ncbi:serine/threonine-protein kinase [Chondromyces apiculatus]|uniref:Serine/threonine protein kinase n=1 Tax=Chondromyces apiculatus DSM 436 TaxID=1192034 RepID=A0A017SZX7_9BACT|nr:serine/threonine-protein kinase [Chondromyces apiculatus]EYF02145.1 Serine/threonine protein kinase [Chondromyces apiculatus DSM 436]
MRPGDVIADRFELEQLAGAGGMGAVYRARERYSGRLVALKILQPGPREHAARFAREAQVLAELRHPGIVRYVAHGLTEDGLPFLAMEWLDGEDLERRLSRGKLTVTEAIVLGRQVADALADAHARGVVHRDIKPGNLFLVEGNVARVRILDFGVAHVAHTMISVTGGGGLVGTLGYMAPEQARGFREVDARADVYGLGCVLFECLTGRRPFAGEHVMAILVKVLIEEPPRPSQFRDDVPLALDDLVSRMLSKDPTDRPDDGAAVAAALEEAGEGTPSQRSRWTIHPALTAGEQRFVSVIVVGAEGSATERADQRTLTELEVNAPFERLVTAVEPFGARLERVADRGAVATLSGEGSATDQATRAARCALAMREALPTAPVAVATGRGVLEGAVPVGEAIDRAVSLLRAHERGASSRSPSITLSAVRLDDVTAGLLDARFDVGTDAAGLILRGMRETELEVGRTLLGKTLPCVGRERDLSVLRGFYEECVSEPRARAVLITADVGVGKSRLGQELLREIRPDDGPPLSTTTLPLSRTAGAAGTAGVASTAGASGSPVTPGTPSTPGTPGTPEVWIARGDPMSAGSPLGMVAQLIQRAAGLRGGEPLAVRCQRIRSRVGRTFSGEDAARIAEMLGEISGTPFSEEGRPHLAAVRRDAMLRADHTRRAFEEFLAAESAAHPVVLVLEDLHWGDLPSIQLVAAALRLARERPLFVLGLSRPEVHALFPRLVADLAAQEIRLDELSRRSSVRLVRLALGDEIPEDLVERLVNQAAGNAFYLEEMIRAVAEGRAGELPATVLAMVQARLAELPSEARRVMRAASLFGQVFWKGGVRALLGGRGAAAGVDGWLASLSDRELIAPQASSAFPGEEEYRFRHALVREAAYQMLTDRDRSTGHRLAGEWLESVDAHDAMALAEHFERGEEPARAATFFLEAAEQAMQANDLDAAIARAERSVACGASKELRGAARRLQAEAHHWRGDVSEGGRCGEEARQLLPRGSAGWLSAAAEAASSALSRGAREELRTIAEDLRRVVTAAPEAADVAVLARVAQILLRAGLADAAAPLIEVLDHTPREAHAEPQIAGHLAAVVGLQALFAGDVAASAAAFANSAAQFERAGDTRNAITTRVNHAIARLCLGSYPEAEAELRAALPECERMGLYQLITWIKHNLGIALLHQGALSEARVLEEEAIEAGIARGHVWTEVSARYTLALVLLRQGELAEAEREAAHAVEVCDQALPARCSALAVLAQTRLWQARPGDALGPATEAMNTLVQLGEIEDGDALVRLVYAEALKACGKDSEARAAIHAARERLLGRAALIAEESWQRQFLEGVPENGRTMTLARRWLEVA